MHINEECLAKAIDWFGKFIVTSQKGGAVDFYAGYMEWAEGYKRELYEAAHSALNCESWDETQIGTHRILDCVVGGLNAKDKSGKNNIVEFHSVTKFIKKSEEDIEIAEDILYRMMKADTRQAFEDACEYYGKWYPIFSYILFMKDCNTYLPVKPSADNHADRFRKLGISTDCLQYCSWDNYQVFLEIHREIQEVLKECIDDNISILDAHSFVWTLYAAPDDFHFENEDKVKNIVGATDFINSIEANRNYKKKAKDIVAQIDEEIEIKKLQGHEREAYVKVRTNQGIFRNRILRRYSRCCLCNVSDSRLLTASHIKPWSCSEAEEKLDPDNGLLLCPNHDFLFDKGWISFEDDGRIIISDSLSASDRVFMNINDDMHIELFDGNKKYLSYHRGNVFGSVGEL